MLEDQWRKLQSSKFKCFSMAIVSGYLTTIGGHIHGTFLGHIETNVLFSLVPEKLTKKSWKEIVPPMPTKRSKSAAIVTDKYLIVAGGTRENSTAICVVEVLDTKTLQWFTANSLPQSLYNSNMAMCDTRLFILQGSKVFSCCVEELLKTCKPTTYGHNGGDVAWVQRADVPVQSNKLSLAAKQGLLIVIGGRDNSRQTLAIRCYNLAANSWSLIGELATPRTSFLTTVLPTNELVVVGGKNIHISCN